MALVGNDSKCEGLCCVDVATTLMHCASEANASHHAADGGCSLETNLVSTEQPGANWFVAPPWHLVAPDGALRSVQSEEELLSLCKEHGLKSSNMRHLVGLFAGNGRPAHVKGWRSLDTVKWIRWETDWPSVPVPTRCLAFVLACD
jgi:hypothetical protein